MLRETETSMAAAGKSGKGKDLKDVLNGREFGESLLRHSLEFYERRLAEVFESRHDVFVHDIVRRLRERRVQGGVELDLQAGESGWIDVESLSRLRNVVGGRFENIKKKWVGAGFPLREHRGDKSGTFEIDNEGWIELSNWMSKHGFESRLRPDKPECLFQIKPVVKPR